MGGARWKPSLQDRGSSHWSHGLCVLQRFHMVQGPEAAPSLLLPCIRSPVDISPRVIFTEPLWWAGSHQNCCVGTWWHTGGVQ